MKVEKPIVIELYELWNAIKSRFSIVSPQPKSFTLKKTVQPVTSLDGVTLEIFDLSDDTSVSSAGGTNTQTLQAPTGFIYQVIDIGYSAPDPAGSGSGSHKLTFKYRTAQDDLGYVNSAFGNAVGISNNGFEGSTSEYPASATDQLLLMRSYVYVSNLVPIDFLYTNSTNVAQAGTRALKIVVKKFPEGAV